MDFSFEWLAHLFFIGERKRKDLEMLRTRLPRPRFGFSRGVRSRSRSRSFPESCGPGTGEEVLSRAPSKGLSTRRRAPPLRRALRGHRRLRRPLKAKAWATGMNGVL